jgi:hypothetical protein
MPGEKPIQHMDATDRAARSTLRASALILSSITTYPRRPLSSWLVAHRLLTNSAATTPRGPMLTDLAVMEPDPAEMATRINRIHAHWGIRYRLTEPEALHIVCLNGILAAEEIRANTVRVAQEYQIDLPRSVTGRFEVPSADATPGHIPAEGAYALHESLITSPALLEGVTTAVSDKATRVRAASGAQQHAALVEEAAKAATASLAPQE